MIGREGKEGDFQYSAGGGKSQKDIKEYESKRKVQGRGKGKINNNTGRFNKRGPAGALKRVVPSAKRGGVKD